MQMDGRSEQSPDVMYETSHTGGDGVVTDTPLSVAHAPFDPAVMIVATSMEPLEAAVRERTSRVAAGSPMAKVVDEESAGKDKKAAAPVFDRIDDDTDVKDAKEAILSKGQGVKDMLKDVPEIVESTGKSSVSSALAPSTSNPAEFTVMVVS